MEEIQIRDALRFHVTNGEPPMGLSAAGLLAQGRRRHWRRMSLASGGTVAMIAMVGAIALVPGGAADPLGKDCVVPLTDYVLRPSAVPTYPIPTAAPSYTPLPYPTDHPTNYPSGLPSDLPSGLPSGLPSDLPSGLPSGLPSDLPSGLPSDLPSVQPTEIPTPYPTSIAPSENGPRPSVTAHAPDMQRIQEMECYLANELQRMVPGVKFAKVSGRPPLKVYAIAKPILEGEEADFLFLTDAVVVGPNQVIQMQVSVARLSPPPTGPDWGWPYFDKRSDLVTRYRTGEYDTASELYTASSTITIYATGTLLSPEQLIELSSGTEMDIFR